MIIVILYKGIQRVVDCVILTGLDLDGNSGESVGIVDQIIHFALVAVIVIKQFASVSRQFLGYYVFIHRAEIDPCFVVQDRTDIVIIDNRNLIFQFRWHDHTFPKEH